MVENFVASFVYIDHLVKLEISLQDTLASKIRITCENYSQIKTSYKYKETRKNMNKNKSIFLKQDKRRGAVNLDYSNYIKNTW